MKAIGALSDGVRVPLRSPKVIVVLFLLSLASAAVNGAQFIDPLYVFPAMAVLYILLPFFLGGIIAVVGDALGLEPSQPSFFKAGVGNYLRILGGGVLLYVATLVTFFVTFILTATGSAFFLGFSSDGGVSGSVLLAAGMMLIAFLLVFLPFFFLQFFPAAIVLEDARIVDSLKRSAGLVRSNLLSVFGFNVVAFVAYLLSTLSVLLAVPTLLSEITSPPSSEPYPANELFASLSTNELAQFLALGVVIGTIVGSIMYTYYVSFFGRIGGAAGS